MWCGCRGGERRGDTAGAGDGRRLGVVRRGRRRGQQATGAGGGGRGRPADAGGGQEARVRRGGQGAEPAQAAATEPRVGAAGPGAEEGLHDGAGGQGQGAGAPQCRARAEGLHAPEREQHAPTDTEEHDGARREEAQRPGARRRLAVAMDLVDARSCNGGMRIGGRRRPERAGQGQSYTPTMKSSWLLARPASFVFLLLPQLPHPPCCRTKLEFRFHGRNSWENNRDGENHNLNRNCGQEGEFARLSVRRLRKRQMRNFFVCLMVSQGVPMFYMGDEYGRTKSGHNNT